MTTETPTGGSTVRRILLGTQLRRLREAKGISREDAGYTIRASESKISRMELGKVSFKERDVADLLILYGMTNPEERDVLVTLAKEANQPGWWHQYNPVLPNWFQAYIGLEESASLIRTYEIQFVPGLLQTEDYARAVLARPLLATPREEVDRRLHVRVTRQEMLGRPDPPKIWAVVEEAALRRPTGGQDVMRAQLENLLEAIKLANVTLQVVRMANDAYAPEAGAFTILRFAEPEIPDIVYTEQLSSALYLDRRDDVSPYLEAMERLCLEGAPPDETADILGEILEEM